MSLAQSAWCAQESLTRIAGGDGSPPPLKLGYTLPAAASTMATLAADEARGAVAYGAERPGLDPSYVYYNLYRDGDPKEAVQHTSDAAFAALNTWLAAERAATQREMQERISALSAMYEKQTAMALEAQRVELEETVRAPRRSLQMCDALCAWARSRGGTRAAGAGAHGSCAGSAAPGAGGAHGGGAGDAAFRDGGSGGGAAPAAAGGAGGGACCAGVQAARGV